MSQYKIPAIILAILVIIGAVIAYFNGFINAPATNAPTASGTDTISVPVDTSMNQSIDNTPLSVQVSNASTSFSLVNYTGVGPVLSYTLKGPIVTLNSNKYSGLDAVIDVYDDNNQFVTESNTEFIVPQGNQVVTVPNTVNVSNQGKYSVTLKLLSPVDKTVLFTKTFNDLLAGMTSYPAHKSVTMSVSSIKDNFDAFDRFTFSIDTKNTGNTDLLGYYKIETYINGNISNADLKYGLDSIGECADRIWNAGEVCNGGRIFIAPGKDYLSDYAKTEQSVTYVPDCVKGDKIDIKVSFYESVKGSPNDNEGNLLKTVSVPTQTCTLVN